MDITQIIIFAGIILIVILMVAVLIYNSKMEKRKKIMEVVRADHTNRRLSLESENKIRDKKRDEITKNLKIAGKDRKNKNSIESKIAQAGLDISVEKIWGYSVASMFLFIIIGVAIDVPLLSLPLFAIIGLFGFPRFILNRLIARRQKKFLEEFSDALDSMVRMLKAGIPPAESIAMVAKEFGGPLGEEMGRIYDSQKLGIPMNEAVAMASERMPIPEMRLFATGIAIQQQTGASLSEVLGNLSKLIRARFRLQRKVQALSAEAKASAMIIGALPIVVAVGLYFVNRPYIELLFTEPTGQKLLTGAIVWMLMGVLVMKQMINFRV